MERAIIVEVHRIGRSIARTLKRERPRAKIKEKDSMDIVTIVVNSGTQPQIAQSRSSSNEVGSGKYQK